MRKMALVAVVVALAATMSYADPVLQVEFGGTFTPWGDGNVSVQSGWSQFQDQGEVANPAKVFGDYTIGIRSGRPMGNESDDTFGAGVTLSAMYVDAILLGAGGDDSTAYVDISGLTAGTAYDLSVWSYAGKIRPTAAGVVSIALVDDSNSVIASMGTWDSSGAAPTSDADFRHDFEATATSLGSIHIRYSGMSGDWSAPIGYINGLTVSEQLVEPPEVPEPATLLLVGTGALGVFGFIRRQRMK